MGRILSWPWQIAISNLFLGGHPPPQTPPISRSPASKKSGSSLPKMGFLTGITLLGSPEADFLEAGGRLIGGVWGAKPPQVESFYIFFLELKEIE